MSISLEQRAELDEGFLRRRAPLLEQEEKARQMAKGLLEIACEMMGISVQDYSSNLEICPSDRGKIMQMFGKLNNELGRPISRNLARSVLLLPPED